MVEVGTWSAVRVPAATPVLVLAVTGVVADGSRGDAGHITRCDVNRPCRTGRPVVWAAFDEGHIAAPRDASIASGAPVGVGLRATRTGNTTTPTAFGVDGAACSAA
ncbi:hypothetical protein [Virgisporangium ochraceum]|uniref:Uncharacterized protein n=1 Tax=Virgisporangium ochraceum TaxID=65505 RepID=A0A8J4EDZ7_9ACTN|nr:hypothetical protein [Virgisporangium ochraceum]GIJ72085.1 hypothetical protein Voc01_070020 [Virgisporangium ochraceum]